MPRYTFRWLPAVLACTFSGAGGSWAQEDGLVSDSGLRDDPIGISSDPAWKRAALPAPEGDPAAADAKYGPHPPAFRARKGRVLTAMAATRESRHQVDVTLEAGLAHVVVRSTFTTSVAKPSELLYRFALPPAARVAALEVCNAAGCRKGLRYRAAGPLGPYDDAVQARGPGKGLPIAHAVQVASDEGSALRVRAAPVRRDDDLRLRFEYVLKAPQHGGIVRLRLPARGMDPRVAPSEIRVSAPALLAPQLAGAPANQTPAMLDPWQDCEITARAPSGILLERWRFPCGSRTCSRVRVSAGARPAAPVEMAILVDASPSTEGPARGRIPTAVAGLLQAAPQGSRAWGLAFAARAQALWQGSMPVERVSLKPFGRAIMLELGSATRFEAAWELIAPRWSRKASSRASAPRLRRMLVIVGDGGLTRGSDGAFELARRAGLQVSALNVADRPTVPALQEAVARTGGVVVDAARVVDNAARGLDQGPMQDWLARLFAPVLRQQVAIQRSARRHSLGSLRAGEERVWQGRAARRVRTRGLGNHVRRFGRPNAALATALAPSADLGPESPATALVAVDPRDLGSSPYARPPVPRGNRSCNPRGPAWRHSGINSDSDPIYLAHVRSCRPTDRSSRVGEGSRLGAGLPAEPLRQMLRRRVIPVARGCFRRDRAGRADYSVRAVYSFELAEQEVVSVRVQGELAPTLRRCLEQAVHDLAVPRFAGRVIVRYPLVTQRELPEPVIKLSSALARAVNEVIGREQ